MPPDLNTRAGKNSRFRHTLRFFREVAENTLDNPRAKCYIKQALIHKAHARVVELADSLDSGSSVHYARAGSSPASRTIVGASLYRLLRLFLQKSERAHAAAPPLQIEPASLGFNGSPEIINASLVCDLVTALQAVS